MENPTLKVTGGVGMSGGAAFVEIQNRAVTGRIEILNPNALGSIKYNQIAEVTIRLIDDSEEDSENENLGRRKTGD